VSAPLVFERVSRWYGPVIALNDVSVSIGPGVVGLLGPNGAGKSTFLRLAAGQLQPNQGTVSVFGRPAWGTPAVFERLGWAPETDGFWEGQTGLAFVTSLLLLHGFEEGEARRRAEAALADVRLSDVQGRRVGGYSRGMRQRLKLAQALAHDPEILLLDEPLNGLDPVNRRHVVDRVKALGAAGKTVLVSSHVLHEVEAMTRRIVLVHKGHVVASGEVAEIRALVADPSVLSVRFADDGSWLTVQTALPDAFFAALQPHAPEYGVAEMFATDDDLESLFRYLVPR
jgi:ABC-2 type transport system ATP-binding protein